MITSTTHALGRGLSRSLAILFLTLGGTVFGQVSQSFVQIGGPGAVGCQFGDPPLLSGGVPASAALGFSYDQSTGRLTLTVDNTSPVIAGQSTPIITRIWFNLPLFAVTGLSLVEQHADAGATPNFGLTVDTNTLDGAGSINVNCLGRFGVQLANPGPGPQGGLANPQAVELAGSPGSQVLGRLTVVLQVAAANLAGLNSDSFASTFSQGAAFAQANAALKFQGAGVGGAESGTIGNAPNCEAAGFIIGEPKLGHTVFIAQNAAPGCFGCVVASLDPGPTQVGPYLIPLGLPAYIISSAFSPPNGVFTFPISIPPDIAYLGLTVYFAFITSNPEIDISQSFQFTITL